MSFGSRFLSHPDRFPAVAGRPDGDAQVVVDFVGGPHRVAAIGAEVAAALTARYGAACGSLAAAADGTTTAVVRAVEGEFLDFRPARWEYDFDLRHGRDLLEMVGLGFAARVELAAAPRATLWIAPRPLGPWAAGGDPGLAFVQGFDNFFRALVAYRLLRQGGVILHSAAVVRAGVACVFLGHEGAGKTTVARLGLAAGGAVLSDDQNAVMTSPSGPPVVERLPFCGEIGGGCERHQPVPLAGLFHLRQASAHFVRPLRPGEGLAALLASAPPLNHDPHAFDRLTDVLARISGAVPCFELSFARDEGVWGVVDRALGG